MLKNVNSQNMCDRNSNWWYEMYNNNSIRDDWRKKMKSIYKEARTILISIKLKTACTTIITQWMFSHIHPCDKIQNKTLLSLRCFVSQRNGLHQSLFPFELNSWWWSECKLLKKDFKKINDFLLQLELLTRY